MLISSIRETLEKAPFRPFTFRLTDDRSLPVPHPEMVAIAGLTLLVASPKQDGTYSAVDSQLVVSMDFEAIAKPTGGNGPQS